MDPSGMKVIKHGKITKLRHKVIDNFLPKYSFNRLKSLVESADFPYYYHDFTVRPLIGERRSNDFMFVHSLVREKEACSNYVDAILVPIIDQLEVSFDQVIRSKINLTPRSPEHHRTDFHVDQEIDHTVALFYITTCNGYTELKNGTKIDCRANRMLLFDGSFKHRAVSHTNDENKIRIIINTNLKTKPFYQS
tara:strand:+ start:92 stop:670 length:579 start_codon:yes stop_codon:yes gene_type:complete